MPKGNASGELILSFVKLWQVSELRYVPAIKAMLYKMKDHYYLASDSTGNRKEVDEEDARSFINAIQTMGVLLKEQHHTDKKRPENNALVWVVKDTAALHELAQAFIINEEEAEKARKQSLRVKK